MAGSDRALRWLQRDAEYDHWTGFATLAGRSDVWVTGFVVAHIAPLLPRSPLIARARRYLAARRHRSGGWGYNGELPADADSTAWCLAALARSPALAPADRRAAAAFLAEHLWRDGVRTYLPASGIRDYIGATPVQSTAGWNDAHPDVTAAALLTSALPDRHHTLEWLVGTQDRAGVLPAYWWRPRYYTAALTLRAFARHRLRPPDTFMDGIAELLERKQLDHGGYGLGASYELDAFSTALAIECYAHLGRDRVRRRRAAVALAAAQASSGAWRGDYVLRIPTPSEPDPSRVPQWSFATGGGNSYVLDRDGVFATTLACHALTLHERMEAGEYAGIQRAWQQIKPGEEEADMDVDVVVNTQFHEDEPCAKMPAGPPTP